MLHFPLPSTPTTPSAKHKASRARVSPLSHGGGPATSDSETELVPASPTPSDVGCYGKGKGHGGSDARVASDPYGACSQKAPLVQPSHGELRVLVPLAITDVADQPIFRQGAAQAAIVQ